MPVFYEWNEEKIWRTTIQHTFRFVEQHIPHRLFESYGAVPEGEYDAFVAGSDQVWRPVFFYGDIADAYLRFAQGWPVKRIAYAVSFGVDTWEYTDGQTAVCARLAKMFDAVSVRESSAVGLCRTHLGVEAAHVVDPTLLLERADYEALIDGDATPHRGEILNYILDRNGAKHRIIDSLVQSTGKRSFSVNVDFDDKDAPVQERIQPSVESWLQGFRDADMVVTDSFHACVFSIIFNKPFYVVGNYERGLTRVHSLLALFGLEDRLVAPDGTVDLSSQIDWEAVNARRKELKAKSLDFLSSVVQ